MDTIDRPASRCGARIIWALGALAATALPHGAGTVAATAAAADPTRPLAGQPAPSARPRHILLRQDMRVRLMVLNEVSTRRTRPGERFVLRVDEPLSIDGTTVIPVGARAWGEVTFAKQSDIVGKSGKLSARLLYIEHGSDRIPLRGESRSSGASGTTATVLGILGLGPFGLFAKGNNARLKAGEIFDGYLEADMWFDSATSRIRAFPPTDKPVAIHQNERRQGDASPPSPGHNDCTPCSFTAAALSSTHLRQSVVRII